MAKQIEIVKKGHKIERFTDETKRELRRCMEDPIYFIENYVMIQHPTEGRVPCVLYDYQKELVRTFHENKKTVALLGRQMGKCLTYNTRISKNGQLEKIGSLKKPALSTRLVDWLEKRLINLAR
jgi:hypothetical protein